MHRIHSRHGLRSSAEALLVVGLASLSGLPFGSASRAAGADDGGAPRGQARALLIGVEQYHRAPRLRFILNDVRQIATTLRTCGDFSREHILELTDQAPNPRFQPLKASLLSEIPQFLKQAAPTDRVLVYFSGHGFQGQDGKLYLAPIDCDPANPDATGIPVEWFRAQVAGCPAELKLLIIDACHAGSEKGPSETDGVTSANLLSSFQGLEKVVTLASSSAKEKSQIWEDKQQSLFSFWLNRGLRGHADKDGDGVVDIDELYQFVHRNVTHTSETRFPRKQTPTRIVRTGVEGVPAVIRVHPRGLKQTLDDLAEQLALDIEEQRLDKVGVLEFTNDTRLGEMLGTEYGALGKWCAEELERRLIDYGTRKFSVVDRRRLQTALRQQGFNLDHLGSAVAMKSLAKGSGGMPAIVLGTLGSRRRSLVTLQCKVVQTESGDVLGNASGTVALNESEWAMFGRSTIVTAEDRVPPGPDEGPPYQATDALVARLDERAQGPHALQDPRFTSRFRVYLKVNGKVREGAFHGNDYVVRLHRGEEYTVCLENRSGQIVHVRLLVDGLNTLPEKVIDKGIETWDVGARVNLDEARAWILDPAKGTVFRVSGFTTKTGVRGNWKRFVVDDAEQSLAGRRKFTEQLGLITAAFYAEGSGTRSVGTRAGRDEQVELHERSGLKVGNLLGVVHIRYVDAGGAQSRSPAKKTGRTRSR